ncbi:MAG: exo-beta-N-acetylmuramidase NamZ domain-containing protein, partial [Chitinophagales bacterium]
MNNTFLSLIAFLFIFTACQGQHTQVDDFVKQAQEDAKYLKEQEADKLALKTGAEQIRSYINELNLKSVALVVNQTSTVGETHLVDTLLTYKVDIQTIFAPEHGFRGTADAGEKVDNGKDAETGLPIISLYGSHKKPTKEDLEGVEKIQEAAMEILDQTGQRLFLEWSEVLQKM